MAFSLPFRLDVTSNINYSYFRCIFSWCWCFCYSLSFFCPRQIQINNGVGRNSTLPILFCINLKNGEVDVSLFHIVFPQMDYDLNQIPESRVVVPRQRCSILSGLTSSTTTRKEFNLLCSENCSPAWCVHLVYCSLHSITLGCLVSDFSFTYQNHSHWNVFLQSE